VPFRAGRILQAITEFDLLLQIGSSIYLDNAQYYTGRSYYAMGSLATALTELQAVEDNYPTSLYIDNSLYWIARVYADLVNCTAANATLTDLEARFPGSTFILQAQTYLAGAGC